MQLTIYKSPFIQLKERPRLDTFFYLETIHQISFENLMKWVLKYDMILILKFLKNKINMNLIKWAIAHGSVQSVKFLWRMIPKEEYLNLFEYSIQKRDNMDMMFLFYAKKIPMTNRAFLRSIYLENIQSMQWMIQYGFRWNESHLLYAIENEKEKMMDFMIENYEIFSERIYEKLLESNHLDKIQVIEERLLERKWNRQLVKLCEMKEKHLEKEFEELFQKDSEQMDFEKEFDEIHKSHRTFDCMILFSMVPIEKSIAKCNKFSFF